MLASMTIILPCLILFGRARFVGIAALAYDGDNIAGHKPFCGFERFWQRIGSVPCWSRQGLFQQRQGLPRHGTVMPRGIFLELAVQFWGKIFNQQAGHDNLEALKTVAK
jgi:hypothetical protein